MQKTERWLRFTLPTGAGPVDASSGIILPGQRTPAACGDDRRSVAKYTDTSGRTQKGNLKSVAFLPKPNRPVF